VRDARRVRAVDLDEVDGVKQEASETGYKAY